MAKAVRTFLALSIALAVVPIALSQWEIGKVVQVVNGDTLKVELQGRIESVRLIGVNTPETVAPGKPVEDFGKQASAFTMVVAEGKNVGLLRDALSEDRDKYGRLLRYVFLPDGTLLNGEIIRRGFGRAYLEYAFSRMEEFRELEEEARTSARGLWASEPSLPTAEMPLPGAAEEQAEELTVYVTRTGKKYHREGCPHLSKSKVPMSLAHAAEYYSPCSICQPPTISQGRVVGAAKLAAEPAPTYQPRYTSEAGIYQPKSVYVRGYYRKDGSYVRPHVRTSRRK